MKETCKRDINHVSLVSLVVGWRRLIGCLGAWQAEGLQTQSQPHATGSTHRNCEVWRAFPPCNYPIFLRSNGSPIWNWTTMSRLQSPWIFMSVFKSDVSFSGKFYFESHVSTRRRCKQKSDVQFDICGNVRFEIGHLRRPISKRKIEKWGSYDTLSAGALVRTLWRVATPGLNPLHLTRAQSLVIFRRESLIL